MPDDLFWFGGGGAGGRAGDDSDIERHCRLGFAAANRHLGRPARTDVEHSALEIQGVRDGKITHADQFVAGFEASRFSRAAGLNFGNHDSAPGPASLFTWNQSMPGRCQAARADHIRRDQFDLVDRQCKANPLRSSTNGHVDSDQLTVDVDERPA